MKPVNLPPDVPANIRVFFQRHQGTNEGWLTVIEDGKKVFTRLPCRTGQASAIGQEFEWTRGRGPIPALDPLYLWTSANLNGGKMFPTSREGIGRFYHISSGGNKQVISKPGTSMTYRVAIGIHPENGFKGSAGCVVLIHDLPSQRENVKKLFAYLDGLAARGIKRVRFTSFIARRKPEK